jgi:protocatechuate 3,4-dioxygenase beta subunit
MHDDNEGLSRDLETLTRRMVQRRQVLRWALGGSLISLIGCSSSDDDPETAGSGAPVQNGGTCSPIPEETAGPYPGDGTNGNATGVANALVLAGIVRSDITSSFAGPTGVADGVPLTIRLVLVDATDACSPLEGYAIYLWHCDSAGNYSMYSAGAASENYCRGVQETDADGVVEFQSIFPACYPGRWPHIHFEMFPSLDSISSATNKVATSQLALPKADCDAVFATEGYEASVGNLAQLTLATDGIFRDGSSLQLATVTGNVTDGYVATLTVAING